MCESLDYYVERCAKAGGGVVVIAGSGSDSKHIDKVAHAIERYEIPLHIRICSAHKQPEKLREMIKEYTEYASIYRIVIGYVAIAGGTDALSGMLAYNANGPVISCPPDATPNSPNISCLTNPVGSSNAYIARAQNVGRFFAQIFSTLNPNVRAILEGERVAKIEDLKEADRKQRGYDGA